MTHSLPPQSELVDQFPGRQREIAQFYQLLDQPSTPLPPALFVSGHTATGKTSLVCALLTALPRQHWAYINAVERFTPRLLFEDAINQFSGTRPVFENGVCRGRSRCDSAADFVQQLRELFVHTLTSATPLDQPDDRRILVIDHSERLRDISASLLPTLLRLAELTEQNVCVVLISSVIWDKLRPRAGALEPVQIRFSDYGKGAIQDIVMITARDCPNEEEMELFINFVSVVHDVFHRNCKDLNELRHLVAMLYPVYIQPLRDGYVRAYETSKLFKLAQPHFARAGDKLYLRDISSAEWSTATAHLGPSTTSADSATEADSTLAAAPIELPYYSKFLLIAAFLASYNPTRLDTRYFTRDRLAGDGRRQRKRQKRSANTAARSRPQQLLLGPKVFSVERMMGIFYSIIEDDVAYSLDLQSQIASLFTVRLLARVSNADRLDDIRCRCNVSYDFIQRIAHSVRFTLDHFLFDAV